MTSLEDFLAYIPVLRRYRTSQFLCFIDKGCNVMGKNNNYLTVCQDDCADAEINLYSSIDRKSVIKVLVGNLKEHVRKATEDVS